MHFFNSREVIHEAQEHTLADGRCVGALMVAALPSMAQEELTESFISSDGTLTFNYPEGWSTEELLFPGVALVINREATGDSIVDYLLDPIPGDVVIQIIGPQGISFVLPDFAATSLEETLETIEK